VSQQPSGISWRRFISVEGRTGVSQARIAAAYRKIERPALQTKLPRARFESEGRSRLPVSLRKMLAAYSGPIIRHTAPPAVQGEPQEMRKMKRFSLQSIALTAFLAISTLLAKQGSMSRHFYSPSSENQ